MPRKKKPSKNSYLSYVILPESWSYDYGFGVDKSKDAKTPYFEHSKIRVRGKLASPNLRSIQFAEIDFRMGSGFFTTPEESPQAVGYLSLEDNTLNAATFSPTDLSPSLIPLLQNKLILSITLEGKELKHRKDIIRSFWISTELEED